MKIYMGNVNLSNVWEMFKAGDFENPTVISWDSIGTEMIAWANGKDGLEIRVEDESGVIYSEYAIDEEDLGIILADAQMFIDLADKKEIIEEPLSTMCGEIDEVLEREDELTTETYNYLMTIMPDMEDIGLTADEESDLIYDLLDNVGIILAKHGVLMYRPCYVQEGDKSKLVEFPYGEENIDITDGYRFSKDFIG